MGLGYHSSFTGTQRQRHRRGSSKSGLAGTGQTQRAPRHYNVHSPFAPTAEGKKAEREYLEKRESSNAPGTQSATAARPGYDPYAYRPPDPIQTAVDLSVTPKLEELGLHKTLGQEIYQKIAEYGPLLIGPGGADAVVSGLVKGATRGIAEDAATSAAGSTFMDALKGIKAGERTAAEAGAQAGARQEAKSAVGRLAQKAEPGFVRTARQKAASLVERAPKPVRTGARVAGRGASYPIKHPIQAPFALQAPVALAHGDPSAFLEPLHGAGVEASIASAAGHLAPIAQEAVSLPAAVVPTLYLAGKAGLSAAQGNSKELDELKQQYLDTGLLPAIASGNPSEALKRLGEHPLYGLLEASGAEAVAGRGAGALARELSGGHLAGTERAPIPIEGTGLNVQRRYSPDLIRQLAQRGFDRTPAGKRITPDSLRGQRKLREAANRFESNMEAVRKQHIQQDMQSLQDIGVPTSALQRVGRRLRGKPVLSRKQAETVSLAVERIIQHPETFTQDLPTYRRMLEDAAKERLPNGQPALDKYQRQMNADNIERIKKAESLKPERVQATVDTANAFIDLQKPVLEEMVDLGLIDPRQAEKAAAVSFARVHMGSDYGVPRDKQPLIAEKIEAERQLAHALENARKQNADPALVRRLDEEHSKAMAAIKRAEDRHSVHLDKNGEHLPLDVIKAEMQSRGVEPPGFLSHRAPSPGDMYRPNFGGATLDKGARTGESVATGSQLGGIDALVRQLRRARGLVDRAKSWNKAVDRFGIKVPSVHSYADAKLVMRDPERYGIDPRIDPVAVPRHPFMADKTERLGALEHQNPEIAGESMGRDLNTALSDALDSGKAQTGSAFPDETPVVFMPRKVVEQLRSGAAPAGGGLRAAQAATSLFTRTVLPFSPGWYIGNGVDNAFRTVAAGINPAHFVIGHYVNKRLAEDAKAELLAGAHYSSQKALNPHRSVESIVRGSDKASRTVRAASEWANRHGTKQAIVKFGPELLSHSSDVLIAANKFLTEDLPQRGALGKLALKEMQATQGSWTKALIHLKDISKDFNRKVVDPNKMLQFQKDLEEIYGNYTRMSPFARKVLRNVSPFWTWFRAAYKFVYVTLPVHRPILTAGITGAARATQPTREQYGLDKEGKEPVPPFMQGSIPLSGGGIFPASNYSSFGYASNPLEALARLPFPQFSGVLEALRGRDWKGEPLEGGDSNKFLTALWTLGTAFVPGAPLFTEENEGKKVLGPHLPKLPHPYDAGYVKYKRTPTQQITVPKSGSGSSGGVDSGVAGYMNNLGGSSGFDSGVAGYMEGIGR